MIRDHSHIRKYSNPHVEIVTCDIYGLVSKRPGSPGRFFYAFITDV